MMRILVFTTLYPNDVRPDLGIFVETRLRHLVAGGKVEAKVLAPVPWFPSADNRWGEWSEWARVAQRETRHGIEVRHPRYLNLPKIGMAAHPFLLAASAYRAALAPLHGLEGALLARPGAVADAADRCEDGAQLDLARMPAQARVARHGVHLHRLHAGHARDDLLDQPCARRASNALDDELRFAIRAAGAHESRLDGGIVIEPQVGRGRVVGGTRGRRGAQAVVIVQALPRDHAGHGLAAGAAKAAPFARRGQAGGRRRPEARAGSRKASKTGRCFGELALCTPRPRAVRAPGWRAATGAEEPALEPGRSCRAR